MLLFLNFYPRPLRGGRRRATPILASWSGFLSTPSARRATDFKFNIGGDSEISIHALCEEGDHEMLVKSTKDNYFYPRPLRGGRRRRNRETNIPLDFYPRPLRGGRPTFTTRCSQIWEFLSTPSARRATDDVRDAFELGQISIHALCEEGDSE